ncbi:MAG: metallophosphatase [Ramlibacter sp.]|jgi:3',5'-cyclic AMP phosphodiesterase CpdA|nr:metallophosphatase [Ramlibacter sp.]
MKTLVHLSDIHFGRTDEAVVAAIVPLVHSLAPDVVVISGDLTQRAKPHEFRAARRFLDALPGPQIVVPGNHDVPLYNVFQRFLQPLNKYRRFISQDLEPFHADDEIAVAGINTARSLTFKDGRINEEQMQRLHERLAPLPDSVTKFVVTHHPFDLPEGFDKHQLVGRADQAMQIFLRAGADVLLAGHLHTSHIGSTAIRYPVQGRTALVVQAGTATSTRGRGESNSFNRVRADGDRLQVERWSWDPAARRFAEAASDAFVWTDSGWQPAP